VDTSGVRPSLFVSGPKIEGQTVVVHGAMFGALRFRGHEARFSPFLFSSQKDEGLPRLSLWPVSGLLPPTRGEVLVEGKPVEGVGRDRGMVFQAYTSFGWLTVRENVEYGLRLRSVPRNERRKMSDKYLKSVGLDEFADHYPKDLSGGMKQRVAIARTLINQPKLVLMDEPFSALDPQTRWGMQSLLLDVSRSEDNTILFVTHDVSEAVYLADTIYVMAPRPTHILHRIDVPFFANRDIALKSSTEFRNVEKKLLDLLYSPAG